MRYILKCKQLMPGLSCLSSGGDLVAKSCLTLVKPLTVVSYRLLCPLEFPGKNTGGSSHSLLPEIFPTQGLNCITGGLRHYRRVLYQLSHQGRLYALVRSLYFNLCIV